MDTVSDKTKITFALSGGVFGWFFGAFDAQIYVLIAFVAFDYITGVLVAIHNKRVSSEIGFRGISKKVMIFALVALGNVMDQFIISSGNSIRTMIIMFYLSNEGISIIENAGNMGLPLPKKLKDIIRQISNHDNDI